MSSNQNPTDASILSLDPHAWAREMVARMNVGPVLAVALLRGGIEVLTDDPERRAALRSAIEASDAALPSIAWNLAELAHAVHAAADTLREAARASERGLNEDREDLIRKAREELRAVLANENVDLIHKARELLREVRANEEVSPE